jgi:hypothetical protein
MVTQAQILANRSNAQRHGGRPEVVYTCKQESKGMWIGDLDRGVMPGSTGP